MKIILIDGNSLIYRTFYAIREMNNSKGLPTNAIYGFVNILVKIQEEFKPDYLAVAFDLKGPTFRHLAYKDYKGGRQKMPEGLAEQFPILKDLLEKMNITILEKEGYEADDIIGSFAKISATKGIKVDIITGDRDAFQLVDENINVLYTKKGISDLEVVDKKWIKETYGLKAKELIELKALMGDKSDNIPGIVGIGEKTGIKLIKEYKNLENLYQHTDALKGKQKERIIAGKEDAFISRMLGTITVDIPWDYEYEDLRFQPLFNEESVSLLKELEFNSLLNRMDENISNKSLENNLIRPFKLITSKDDLQLFLGKLSQSPYLFIYCYKEENDLFLSLNIGDSYVYLDKDAVKATDFFKQLKEWPDFKEIKIISHEIKALLHLFHQHGIDEICQSFDILLAVYLLSPDDLRYDLKSAAFHYLNEEIKGSVDIFGKGKKRMPVEVIDPEILADYMIKNCEIIKRLEPILKQALVDTQMIDLYQTIEIPLLKVMASMEELGFTIDQKELKKLADVFEEKLEILTKEIHDLAEVDSFNINSPKQLSEVLFEKLKLPVIKKTKTGYSTNIDVLEQLVHFHPVIQKIIDYRSLAKLDSTYGRGLINFVDSSSGKIYSTFNQTVAATGRISSSSPNLQNIPIRTEMGREIRRVFIPSSKNRILVDADYSQIELRVLAHLSDDDNLIDAFLKEQDIHTRTASEIFDVSLEDVSRTQRGQAKAINFGLIYGKQAFSLGKDLGISRNEAQEYIDRYFNRYPKVLNYMETIKKQAKDEGYVTTIWGRRRYIPEMNSRNGMLVQAGERMALNTPIQGSAADIIKIAMISVYNRLKTEKLKADLILQVHDELIIDTPLEEEEEVKRIIKEEMEGAASLKVPLTVDVNTGFSWYDIK